MNVFWDGKEVHEPRCEAETERYMIRECAAAAANLQLPGWVREAYRALPDADPIEFARWLEALRAANRHLVAARAVTQ